jgi:hypothetical protein
MRPSPSAAVPASCSMYASRWAVPAPWAAIRSTMVESWCQPCGARSPAWPAGRTVKITGARKVLGWPKRCKLAHVFLWEYS